MYHTTTQGRYDKLGSAYQAAILQLLDTELSECIWVICQVQGVEGASWI